MRRVLLKGVILGASLSLLNIIAISLDISVLDNISLEARGVYYISIMFIAIIINFLGLKSISYKDSGHIMYSALLSFIAVEVLSSLLGVIRFVFKLKHGFSEEMWAGDGFGMLFILLLIIAGSIIGCIVTFVYNMLKKTYTQ